MAYLLAIDAGTGSCRAVLFTERGIPVASAGQEWHHRAEPGIPGSMEFLLDQNWSAIVGCIRSALHDAGADGAAVAAVSASSMREGIVLHDRDGRELWACANVDSRAAAEVAELKRRSAGLEQWVYGRSGQTFALGALPRLRWLQWHRPDLYERAATLEMLSDWVITRLTGERCVEPSNGCTTGMMSLERRDWAPELARACGVREDIVPPVVEPGTIVGQVTHRAADETGLRAGTPVAAGGGDAQLAALALGLVEAGQTAVIGGTFWQQVVNLPRPQTDERMRIRVNCHVLPDLWQAEAIVFHPGLAVRWFRDTFCQAEMQAARERGINAYDVLTEQAAAVPPGANGVIPVLSDVMNYGDWRHAAPSFLNLSLEPGRTGKAALFRSLLENAAVVTAANLDTIMGFTGTRSDEVVFGGGSAKSSLWAQILADVLRRPVRVPQVKEATALGTAICAGTSAGVFGDLRAGGAGLVRWERCYEPDEGRGAVYAEVAERWAAAYPAQLQLATDGVTEPLWTAPGL